jgi:K+-transporting ATPase ATPase C chain
MKISSYFSKSLLLLAFAVGIVCIVYPAVLLATGQLFFPFQANGSVVKGPDGKLVGSVLIAQPFTKNEYFWSRPSAAGANGYDASASSSSALAPSNYALRSRVATMLGPIVTYHSGPKAGQLVAPDIETWFQKDIYQGNLHIVSQWANAHNSIAQGWVTADPTHGAYVDAWAKKHPAVVAQFIKDNPGTPKPAAADLAVVFFQNFSEEHPGKFPSAVTTTGKDGKSVTSIEPVNTGSDIQSNFFDMWRQDHADADLENVPGDYVTTSASGLDPHISLQNAEYQLERVSSSWATDLKRNPADVKKEVQQILQKNARAPLWGLWGEKMVNVFEVNLTLRNLYGAPPQ